MTSATLAPGAKDCAINLRGHFRSAGVLPPTLAALACPGATRGIALATETCSIEGCGSLAHARGMCNKHHKRWLRTGNPLVDGRRSTPDDIVKRFWAKVDKTDNHWLWTAATNLVSGYGVLGAGTRGKLVLAHRFAYELLVGPIPFGKVIDHDYRCPKNCVNPDHLRLATPKQNGENRAGLDAHNTSGVRGVSWDKHRMKWQAYVHHNGKRIGVGRFTDLREAEAAVIAKRNELFTHNDADRKLA